MNNAPLDMDVRFKRGEFSLNVQITAVGGITALFGRSGVGKSTIVAILAGLLRPDEGSIRLGDHVLFDSAQGIDIPPHLRGVGCVFQDARLFPHLSVTQNLTYGINRLNPSHRVSTYDRVVDLLGLKDLVSRRPLSLSGGEKQRVSIGRALLSNPRFLLMDEPLANLDGKRKDEILPYIEHICEAFSIPVIYVSHAIDEVIRLADTLVLLDSGQAVAQGTVEDIMGRLDLSPLTGRYEAGAVLNTTVLGHDHGVELTRLGVLGHTLFTPKIDLNTGQNIRLRLRARDISLALGAVDGTSILNQLPVVVKSINMDNGPHVELSLAITPDFEFEDNQPQIILARITRKSFSALNLAIGKPAHALIKAVAIDRRSLGSFGKTNRRKQHPK